MNRRALSKLLSSAAALAALPQAPGSRALAHDDHGDATPTGADATPEADATPAASPSASAAIAMLLYPGMTALDLIGPQMFFVAMPERTIHLVWKNRDVIESDTGVRLQPTATFAETPEDLEILFVPGGLFGTAEAIQDPEVVEFVASRGARAQYVTSVCTGSMLLGAAGLLNGYQATSHWAWRDLLPLVGAEPVNARIVEDRNRITGGGVTSGIDFGLTLLAKLAGQEYAAWWQLATEYDPAPPFQAGTPEQAGPAVTAEVSGFIGPYLEATRQALLRSPGYVES